jgi:hypothetical protein
MYHEIVSAVAATTVVAQNISTNTEVLAVNTAELAAHIVF